jgi:xanthine dehydrogenase FAD-binding subunit
MFDLGSYHRADTVEEAVTLLVQNPDAVPIAGGTDVLVRLHGGDAAYRHLVDIHDVAELKGISLAADGAIVVGSGTTFAELLEDEIVRSHLPALAEGAASVGGPQVRNMGTVGGNICNGAPSADTAAPLLVHDAVVVLRGPDGTREVALPEFYLGPSRVDRHPAEIMTSLRIAAENYRGWGACYHKYSMRGAMDIATIGCAAACKLEGHRVSELRFAYTVAGPTPLRCWKTEEKVRGATADQALLKTIREAVLEDLKPRDSWRASKAFREQIIVTLAERVSREALTRNGVSL